MRELARRLQAAMRGEVLLDHPLAPHTNYRVGGPADLCLMPLDCADLAAALAELSGAEVPWCVLGGGANVLVSDRGVRGVVILTAAMTRLQARGHQLLAGAGVESHAVAVAALDHGLTGAEFLAWLPGSIGGACFMNAKAYGGEISMVLREARVVTRQGQAATVTLGPGDFSYKRSPFQRTGDIICQAGFALRPGDPAAIAAKMDEIEQSRRSKHEMDHPSCGCVFENDRAIGTPSGLLIERAGLKGYRVGEAEVSAHHANFVLNTGHASAADLRAVMDHVRATVQARTGHQLTFEVQFIGDW